MNLVLPHPEFPFTSRGQGLGINVHLQLDLVDVLAVLRAIRVGIKHSPGMKGVLAERVLSLHEFLLDQLPDSFRCRVLRGTFLG
jgi:hypothetical protein